MGIGYRHKRLIRTSYSKDMTPNYKVLSPKQFSGSLHGDYGYEVNGIKSKKGYVSRKGAQNALYRKLDKLQKLNK